MISVQHKLEGIIPNTEAGLHCKQKISVDQSLLPKSFSDPKSERESENGYLKLQMYFNGFDSKFVVVMQPPDKFYDFNFRAQTQYPAKQSFVGISQWDRTFIFPAEYDIFLDYSPSEYYPDTDQTGYVNINVEHIMEPIPDFIDRKHTIV